MFGTSLSLSPHHTRFWRFPVLVALLLMSLGLLTTLGGGQRAFAAGAVSPSLFGSNLSLSDGNDAFLTNPRVAQTAQQLHVTMMRFPDRGNLAVTTAAARHIQALGMVPLEDPPALMMLSYKKAPNRLEVFC